jgi:hypothetical protein
VRELFAPLVEHLQDQLVAGPEPDLLGNPSLIHPLPLVGPLAGQVQPDIDQGVFPAGDVPEVDPDLAVLDLSQPTAPLPGHTDRRGPLLRERRRVEHEDAIGFAEFLADLVDELGQQWLVVPGWLADELLQRLALLVVEVGDGLDVLGLDVGEQSLGVVRGVVLLGIDVEGGDEGLEERLQTRLQSAQQTRMDLGIRE